ncbi:major facilitator superfamily domain-containing protein [Lasiosphaeris hirsuta]|uniref:Major facilitator superfamily domain-containing protein n=1 Tax=Lasiosphaeris hirsuta TaxID=260670 RepID=A0AA40DXZ0_9PEZI|nr:major facilitator superfamily domain-containing protein [Lasiosphaeris hirsuta]
MRPKCPSAMSANGSGAAPKKQLPPFPRRQLLILALCRICEPVAFMSIFPYIYYMIRDFNITNDESQISFYAGMVTSSFTFAEFATSVFWGRLSDKIGRKPVLLMGLGGTGLSVLLFGFSPSLPIALFARALGGFLNGNIGVLQTTVAELVTVKEHQPRAYSVMPMVWCLGSIVGPMIGGALAKPVENIPSLFSPGSIWDKFPYLLPNLFSAVCVFIGVIIGLLFLEETHQEKRWKRDRGVELGSHLVSCIPSMKWNPARKSKGPEEQPLLGDSEEPLPGYRTSENSPQLATTQGPVLQESLSLAENGQMDAPRLERATRPMGIFNQDILLIIVTYGILAFHTMTFDALLPVFLSTDPPEHRIPTSLPFKFADGFGYDTKRIGLILSIQGVYSMGSTYFLFPAIVKRMGALNLFRFISMSYPLLYFATPYLVLLPDNLRMVGIYGIVVWKCTFSTLAYPSNAILLTNSAPTTLSLGTINGVAAMTASLSRAFGPAISGMLYSMGLESGYSGLVWWATGLVTIAGAWISFYISEPRGRLDEKEDAESDPISPEQRASAEANK